jgi:hypothetical protein
VKRAALAFLLVALTVAGPGATAPDRALGERAPNISGTTLNGKKLALSWFRGKPVFVNVWASW